MTHPSGLADVPDLVPARMVNEYCYCPRLFFLEWVHAQFADNTDTVEGRWHHRAVDEPGGAVPLPSEGEVRVARSVMLSSESLCDLDAIERIGLMSALRDVIDHRHDSIAFVDLGEPGRRNSARIEFMGTSPKLPDAGPTIV